MLCEQCRMREASIVIREVAGGTVTEKNLCSECASKSELGGLFMDAGSPFARLLSGILGTGDVPRSEVSEDAGGLTCPTCHTSYAEFVRKSRFGCADCYDAFGILLNHNIKKLQGSNTHTGKVPRYKGDSLIRPELNAAARKNENDKELLKVYQAKQQEAVRDEDYEKAAYYRDEIRKLKERIQADHEVV